MQKFIEDFQNLQFWVIGQFNSADWKGHDAIEMRDMNNAIEFRRKPSNQAFDYFAAVFCQPLPSEMRF